MKNVNLYFLSLLMLSLTACTTQKKFSLDTIEDDVYWSKNDDPGKPLTVDDLERQERKNKGPESNYPTYEPATQNTTGSYDNDRAQNAYDTWNSKRGVNTGSATPSNNNNSYSNQNNYNNTDYDNQNSRRFGSQRSYYYSDPYYNSLSSNWGWTSLYTPVVRPGYYNWAPGWNIGIGYNSFGGWGGGMSYGIGWGNMYPGYGYGMYNPWCGYGYSPYYYNPWGYGYGYGYGNPYYGYGYGNPYYGYGYGHGYNNGYGYGYGNDVITNRPLLHPRNSMGSTGGGLPSGSTPRGYIPDVHGTRPAAPAVPATTDGQQNNNVRPMSPQGNVYSPSRPNPAANTNGTARPGGDLVPNSNGTPVYVSPNSRPAMDPNNNTNNTYSDRPGGELRPGTNGNQVYVPSRSSATYYDNNNRQPQPSNDYPSRSNPNYNNQNNQNPNYNQPRYTNPSPSYNTPSRSESPSYNNQPTRTYSPSPTYSSPSPGRSYGGGSGGGGSRGGGGGSAPQSRPR